MFRGCYQRFKFVSFNTEPQTRSNPQDEEVSKVQKEEVNKVPKEKKQYRKYDVCISPSCKFTAVVLHTL